MSTAPDHVARMRAVLDEHIAAGRLSAPYYAEADITAVLAELKQLRAEREGWFNGAAQRLRHAYRSGWDDRGEAVMAALGSVGGFMEAEKRAAAYAAEWWGTPGVWPLPPEQPQAESDADVRAVAALLEALGDDMLVSQAGLDEPAAAALVALQERFAEPIAALDALDARTPDGGAA